MTHYVELVIELEYTCSLYSELYLRNKYLYLP